LSPDLLSLLYQGQTALTGPTNSSGKVSLRNNGSGSDATVLVDYNDNPAVHSNTTFNASATDRDAAGFATIAEAIFGKDYEIATQSYPKSFVDQYQKDRANTYPYSVKKAKAALKASGVVTPVTVQMQIPANNPNFSRFSEIVQAQLKEIGINVEITPSPNLLSTFFQNKQGDFITTLWPARPDPSITIGRNFTPNQVTNAGNNLSPDIPVALAQIQAAATPADARPGYKKAIDTVVDNAYEVPVFFPTLTNVHRTYVTSDDWQIYGSCQGVDFSKVAITTAKKK
jgi:ABC-type transport system substrate-binding protein